MDTQITDELRATHAGRVAEEILRKCVHCGFCTATCPTYQLLGDELDGPRGRIYLIKQVLEGKPVTEKTRTHLDRCLTCRSCETTCPSGVKYSHLLDVGRAVVEQKLPRRVGDAVTRALLRTVLPNPALFGPAVALGRLVKPLLPASLADKLPPAPAAGQPWPAASGHQRRMLALAGCVQPSLAPNINAATARLLDKLGIALFEEGKAGCCGAVRFHLNDQAAGKADMRRNIDAWWPHVEAGVEAIVVTASGCGVQVRGLRPSARRRPALCRQGSTRSATCAAIRRTSCSPRRLPCSICSSRPAGARGNLAFHSPCTLQHGLKITRRDRGIPACCWLQADPGCRQPSVLWLGGNVFRTAA